ncbi:hypothetical protein Pcinc_003401 [Petrolisthes cinctipes]|uniref:Uncharacterized protein n=1 Tax=Petrolisthes cinctipes TaxID=88211 RepID=A0AAE1GGH8_PETCI|nr:hypothetical protein Pcinc_003401 [Petrolisthes cinctipes]
MKRVLVPGGGVCMAGVLLLRVTRSLTHSLVVPLSAKVVPELYTGWTSILHETKQDVESSLVECSLVDHGDLIHVPYTSVVDQYPPPSPPCLTLDHTFEPVPTEGCC